MEMFHLENQNALIVMPAPALIDWVNKLLTGNPFTYTDPLAPDLGSVYLIPACFDLEELNTWLEQHYKEIFEQELFDWWDDKEDWPDMTMENFKTFFHVSWQSMVNVTEDASSDLPESLRTGI